ncbi:MAG: UDP-3-O-(3-hydroxymyristoyl)glucosamine N-acyltransferase [Gammaproteobacteria bacterium]
MTFTVAKLADVLGIDYRGDGSVEINSVASLESAHSGQLGFLSDSRHRKYLAVTKAAAVIVKPEDADDCSLPTLISHNVYASYAHAVALLMPETVSKQGIDASAVVDSSATISGSAWIGPQTVIGAGAVIHDDVQIGPGCIIGDGVEIGNHCQLIARVTVINHATIGQRVLLHPGVVIGSDGFGMAEENGKWIKIPQRGRVRIGGDVEIGANTTVDRGALDDTVIEEGVKIDNQVQVAHNVYIGAHTAIAGCVGISGSVSIGQHCTLAGGVGIAGHLKITDHVHVTAMSVVTRSIAEPGVYSAGTPLMRTSLWRKNAVRFKKLDDLYRRFRKLEKV